MAMSATLDAARRYRAGRSGSDGDGRRSSSRLAWRGDEPIDMRERRHGYFPRVFDWRGYRYDVYAVERCWTVSRRTLGGRVERYCFRVRARPRSADGCSEGTFEIYQDLRHNTWHMQRQVA